MEFNHFPSTKKIQIHDLIYEIDMEKKISSIISVNEDISILSIPYSINFENHDYVITKICSGAFQFLTRLQFSPNSSLQTIEKNAFKNQYLTELTLPSSVIDLKEGWCSGITDISIIRVHPNNKRYKSVDDKYIIGKSNIESEKFDTLIFSVKNVKTVTIPKSIKIISSYCFSGCKKLHTIEFHNDSELQIIEKNAFKYTPINELIIPSNVIDLKEGWCNRIEKLNSIKVKPNNKRYKSIDDKILIGKSNIENEDFDVFVFAVKNTEKVEIPKSIKIIDSYAFRDCFLIHQIEIPDDSNLQIFKKKSFAFSSIEKVKIPVHLKIICEGSFASCKQLNRIEIPTNSELQIIEKNAFKNVSLKEFSIPSNVIDLKDGWCSDIKDLVSIKVNPNNKRYKSIDDKILIGKSNIENEDFDTFILSTFDIEEVTIPKTIKIIKENAFSFHNFPKKVKIPTNSELQIIEDYAFLYSKIKSLEIPAKVIDLKKNWCSGMNDLEEIKVNPNNKRYKSIDDKILIGKSNIENEDYDVLIFAINNIESVTIPKSIKIINSNALSNHHKLTKVEIPEDSELQIIEENAFSLTRITSIFIPSHVSLIKENAFQNDIEKVIFSEGSEKLLIEKKSFAYSKVKNIVIPARVTEIGDGSFTCFQLLEFEIPKNSELKRIGSKALSQTKIEKIFIPKHVTIIDGGAFKFCDNLKTVEFDENSELQIIGREAFYSAAIERIVIPSSVIEIGEGCFSLTKKLTSIKVMPNNKRYKSIDDKFIIGKSNIENDDFDVFVFAVKNTEKVEIPKSIKVIENYAFEDCQELQTFEIPDDSELQIFGKASFMNSSIESIKIPVHVKIIGQGCFSNCKSLKTVEIPNNSELEIIDEYAFQESSIERILLPSNLRKICKGAFCKCNNIDTIEIPNDSKLEIIEDVAFYESSIKRFSIPIHLKQLNNLLFCDCEQLQKVEIPINSELEIIKDEVFYNTMIESLLIPDSVVDLNEGWCSGTYQLNKIKVMPNNKRYKSIDDKFIFGKSKIENDNFDVIVFASRDIEEFKVPNSIISIEPFAFSECQSLQKIEIQNDSNLQKIGKCSFDNTNIKTIKIPSNLEVIGEETFSDCPFFKSIQFSENSKIKIIDEKAFSGSRIESISIPSSIVEIRKGVFENCVNLQKVVFSNDLKISKFDSFCFYSSSIKSISIPPNLTTICESAFECCKNLRYVDIPENSQLKIIEQDAFSDSSIASIYIPSSLYYIDPTAFTNCNLKIIETGENCKIDDWQFAFDFNYSIIVYMPHK